VWFQPRISATTAASQNVGLFASVIDYDDAASPSSVQALLDYQNVVYASGTVGHYRRFKPHVAVAAYTGAFTGYSNVTSPWIDAASTTVAHYGVKTGWTVTDTAYSMDILVRLRTSWRNVR